MGELTGPGIGGGGGGGQVNSVVGTPNEIDVNSADPVNPVVSLDPAVLSALSLAVTAAQPGDPVSIFLNDVPYLTAASLPVGANPTAAVGVSPVNGSAVTFMRSDAAPPLDAAVIALLNGAIQASVLTADGDLLTRAGAVPARIPIGSNGEVLTVVAGAPAWAAAGGGGTPANPTASIGLAVVNGVATTFMRSDAAPPLDQGIAPVWTGHHQFNVNAPTVVTFGDAARGSSVQVALDSVAGISRQIHFRTAGVNRWVLQANTTAESGANAGSNFTILRLDDAGVSLGTAFSITRSNGFVSLPNDNQELRFGASGDDLAIYHDGTNNNIDSNVGALHISAGAGIVRIPQSANPVVRLEGDAPNIIFDDNTETTNQRLWRLIYNGGNVSFATRTDANGGGRNAINIARGTGIAVGDITIGNSTDAPTIQLSAGEFDLRASSFNSNSVIRAGTYTPTGTPGTNVAALTPGKFIWQRIGNTVHCEGTVNLDPTSAAAATDFELSLPIASNFAAVTDLSGQGADAQLAAAGVTPCYLVNANTGNDTAFVRCASIGGTAARAVNISFSYEII